MTYDSKAAQDVFQRRIIESRNTDARRSAGELIAAVASEVVKMNEVSRGKATITGVQLAGPELQVRKDESRHGPDSWVFSRGMAGAPATPGTGPSAMVFYEKGEIVVRPPSNLSARCSVQVEYARDMQAWVGKVNENKAPMPGENKPRHDPAAVLADAIADCLLDQMSAT